MGLPFSWERKLSPSKRLGRPMSQISLYLSSYVVRQPRPARRFYLCPYHGSPMFKMLLDEVRLVRFWLALSATIPVYFFYYVWQRFFSLQGLPNKFPWAGSGRGALARGKASQQSFFGLRELLIDGYNKVGTVRRHKFWDVVRF